MRDRPATMAACLAILFAASAAYAHDPQASPLARVTQRVGAGEITVEYSSPGVKKRKVWGELVPYGKLWRTGANASTKITFTKDVSIAGKPVPAGTYSLFTIPEQKSWTIVLNRNTAVRGNMDNYKQAEDVARVTVAPTSAPARERLTFIFSDATEEGVSLDLEWEKLRVSVPIKMSVS